MALDDIPIRDPAAREQLARDLDAFEGGEPPGFRIERTRFRLEVALRNGLGQREAERLGQLAEPPSPVARWREQVRRAWTSAATRRGLASLGTAMAALLVWVAWSSGPSVPSSSVTLIADEHVRGHRFEDGSSIELQPGSEGQLQHSEERVHFALERGSASFDVADGQARSWRVTARDYEVTVTGTTFRVRYEPEQAFEVEVQRGEVFIRVPDQEAALQLTSGDRLLATSHEVTLQHGFSVAMGKLADGVSGAGVRSGEQPHFDSAQGAHASEGDDTAAAGAADVASASEQNEARESSQRTAVRSGESAVRPGESAVRPGESAVRPGESAVRPGESAVRPGESAVRPGETGPTELQLLSRARKALAAGKHGEALRSIRAHGQRYPKGQLIEEREALRIEALRGMGREGEAKQAAGEFKQRFPKSVLAPQMPSAEP